MSTVVFDEYVIFEKQAIWLSRERIPGRGNIKGKHPKRRACLTYLTKSKRVMSQSRLWPEQISEWESGTKWVQSDTHPVNGKPCQPVLGLWLLLGEMGSEDFEAEEWKKCHLNFKKRLLLPGKVKWQGCNLFFHRKQQWGHDWLNIWSNNF